VFEHTDGVLYWKVSPKPGVKIGDTVGYTNEEGYTYTQYKGKRYMVHNIIYEMVFGSIPDGMVVDHIDRNPLNNRPDNLRLATLSQNQGNRGSKRKFKGVYKYRNGKYRACIAGKHLGYFDCKKQAALAYNEGARSLWGEHAHLNEV
jgi:hypothetical protein